MSVERKSNRWSEKETELLRQVREVLAEDIAQAGQFPEVIGDRGIMRFIRGHQHLDKIIEMYGKYLKWRKDTNADAIRERIRKEKLHKPSMFPNGEEFLSMTEQIIIAPDASDYEGNLIAFETFYYSPSEVMKKHSMEEWNEWMNYTLQYKNMVIEQVSELQERALLKEYNGHPPCSPEQGYGIILQCTSIRCLKGMGMEFLSSSSKAIMKSSIAICQDNFPEMMYKSHMVNTPWVFNTLWYFCKGLMDAKTIAKVSVHGYSFLEELSKEIPITSIPKHFGGQYTGYNDAFDFDWSEFGPMDLAPELKMEARRIDEEPTASGQQDDSSSGDHSVIRPPDPPSS